MTRQEAHRLFERLRAQFAAHRPELRTLRLVLRKRHFLRRPTPRDLAWYEMSDGTVNLMEAALAGPAGRVEGLLAHELGHALDEDATRPYAERRADALAKKVLGVPVRYDDGDVQNLHHGVTPRPARLHENRESEMKRNPRYTVDTNQRGRIEINGTTRFLDEIFEDETALSIMAAAGDTSAKKTLRTLLSGKSAQKKAESIAWMQDVYNVSPQQIVAGSGNKSFAGQVLDGWAAFGREPSGASQEVREAAVRAVRMIDASPMLSVSGSAAQKSGALAAAATMAQAMGLLSDRDQGVLLSHADRVVRNPKKGYKMPEAQARHTAEGLLARMKADGADTFAKKVAWVKKHMPSIDRPRTFVGWVTKGERGRTVFAR